MPAIISSEMRAALELIKNGATPYAAAKEIGIRVSTIYRSRLYIDWLVKHLDKSHADEIERLFMDSISPKDIADKLNIPVGVVYRMESFIKRIMIRVIDGDDIEKISKDFLIPKSIIQQLEEYRSWKTSSVAS